MEIILHESTWDCYRNESSQEYGFQEMDVLPQEKAGFTAAISLAEPAFLCLQNGMELPWQGPCFPRYRLAVTTSVPCSLQSWLVGYIRDGEAEKGDVLLREQYHTYEAGTAPVFIQVQPGRESAGTTIAVTLRLYYSYGYEAEQLAAQTVMTLHVLALPMPQDNEFFLDLWQHPCSWARVYGVPYYSEAHFAILRSYLSEMAELGQKVIDLIVSDYPWAGQACFKVTENAASLYEYNIVTVSRRKGSLHLDFAHLDRYVALCRDCGIEGEIDVFGLIGLWHGRDFGSPLTDYDDPVRISLYDEDKGIYDYVRTKDELAQYVRQLFAHFVQQGWWDQIKIIGDEPGSPEAFARFSQFLQSCADQPVSYKYAVHSQSFWEGYEGKAEGFSISSLLMAQYCQDGQLTGKLAASAPSMTWYPCRFPRRLNTFLSSPLAESRYIGVYTYLFHMKGMLRWAYGLFVKDVFRQAVYKPDLWPTGDMFLVYPGRDMKPLYSLRERNLLYGMQDFTLFSQMSRIDATLYDRLRLYLAAAALIQPNEEDIAVDVIGPLASYNAVRTQLIGEYEQTCRDDLHVCWADSAAGPVYDDSLRLRLAVFIDELGGHRSVEVADEEACQYVVLYVHHEPAATGRLYADADGTLRLQRIAVRQGYRQLGLGKRLIRELESRGFAQGFHRFLIASRCTAQPFYQKLGYHTAGAPYDRDGAVHIPVVRTISPQVY